MNAAAAASNTLIKFYYLAKPATLMRRSSVLSFPLQFAFPGYLKDHSDRHKTSATTLSKITFSITTLSIDGLYVALSITMLFLYA